MGPGMHPDDYYRWRQVGFTTPLSAVLYHAAMVWLWLPFGVLGLAYDTDHRRWRFLAVGVGVFLMLMLGVILSEIVVGSRFRPAVYGRLHGTSLTVVLAWPLLVVLLDGSPRLFWMVWTICLLIWHLRVAFLEFFPNWR